MKYLFALLAATAVAGEAPFIVGTMKNQANADITFTTYAGTCENNHRVVYAQHNGGKIGMTGCWAIQQNQIFVTWADGDVYTYPLDSLKITPEMSAFLNKQTKYQ